MGRTHCIDRLVQKKTLTSIQVQDAQARDERDEMGIPTLETMIIGDLHRTHGDMGEVDVY